MNREQELALDLAKALVRIDALKFELAHPMSDKATINKVGEAIKNPDGSWTLRGWEFDMEGCKIGALQFAKNAPVLFGGYTAEELQVIAFKARQL